MPNTEQYDAIIIGSGQSGGPLSTALVKAGRKTALIEREHVGGTCVNVGCTPTKTMYASARVAYLAGRDSDYGVRGGETSVDMTVVRRRKRDIVEMFRTGSQGSIVDGGVDLIMGVATFTGPHEIEVRPNDGGARRQLTAPEIFIDTGGRPSDPPIDGLSSVPHLDSTSIMELDRAPEHLLVLGGGYVGLEFAQMFRRFGSKVTIVQAGSQLLAREDADIAAQVAEIMREDGITVLLNTAAQRVENGNGGRIDLTLDGDHGREVVSGSHLLVAVGRKPNTEALNLPAAGVDTDAHGFITANGRCETSAPGIWAMGDVAGSPPFTHMSYDDFRIVRDNLLHGGNRSRDDRLTPYTVFIDPQLGRVGLGEDEARAQGRSVRVAKMPMSHVARAIEFDEQRGCVKAVVDGASDQILGATVLGLEGGEIMAMFEIAMMGNLPYTALREGIFAHPTLAELMNTLFQSFAD